MHLDLTDCVSYQTLSVRVESEPEGGGGGRPSRFNSTVAARILPVKEIPLRPRVLSEKVIVGPNVGLEEASC